MGAVEWSNFLGAGIHYYKRSVNRPAGTAVPVEESLVLANFRGAYAALNLTERTYYAAAGGPNFLLKHAQALGGGRATL